MPKLLLKSLSALLITLLVAPALLHSQEPQSGEEKIEEASISFTFQFAPWNEVLKWYADKAGLSLDPQDVPEGTFNYYDARKYTVSQTLDVLNGYLIPKGYLLVRRDNFLVSLNVQNGVPPSVVPNVALDEIAQRGDRELMRVVLPIRGMNVAEAAQEIEKLLGPLGKVVLLPSANSVAITGLGGDLVQIQKLYSSAETVTQSQMVFRVFPLKQIPAIEADRTIRRFLELPSSDAGSNSTLVAGPLAKSEIRMTYETRTNSLLVTASEHDLTRIEQLLQAIDVEANSAANSFSQPRLHIIRVEGVKSADIGQALGALSPASISVDRVGTQSTLPATQNAANESTSPEGR